MKKMILSAVFISIACALGTHAVCQPATLKTKLARATAAAKTTQPTWQEQLAQLQASFKKSGALVSSATPSNVSDTHLNTLRHKTYQARMQALQNNLSVHPVLKGYAFAAPIPADLASLSYDNYEALTAFFANAQTAQVTQAQAVYPFTLSLHVKGIAAGEVELWVDEPTQTIYLMSDNLHLTAAGKYNLPQLVK